MPTLYIKFLVVLDHVSVSAITKRIRTQTKKVSPFDAIHCF
jgi:hypothetical protein